LALAAPSVEAEGEAVTETMPNHMSGDARSWARRAWIALALSPVGLLAGLVVMYIVAALMGVIIEPADGQHASLAQRVVILGISGLVWLVAPAVGFVRARRAATGGSRSGRVALVASILLLVLTVIITVGNIINPGNMM
jgi:hypothetical protein